MVVGFVEGLEFLVGQGRDDGGVAAGIQAVGGVREEQALGEFAEHGVGRGIDALHFIKDHAAADEFAGVGELVVPAFLLEDVRRDARVEHGVEVDVDQVVEIPEVGRGHGVAGLVRVGEGVEEGLQRAFEQFDEGLLDGVFARAAQDRVFEDMGHAGGVGRRRAEADAEDLVGVVEGEGEDLRPGAVVAAQDGPGGVLGKVLVAKDRESVFSGHCCSCCFFQCRGAFWRGHFFSTHLGEIC